LLEHSFGKAREFPETDQEYLAALILEWLEDDALWDQQFAASASQLEKLAEEALAEFYRSNRDLDDKHE
jgi:hypothetical protein